MGTDQAHEKNHRAVKADGGTNDIVNNESALLEWALCSRRIKLIEAFKHFEKSFSDPSEELINIVSKELKSAKASSSFRSALQIYQSQCNAITKERLNAVNMKPT